MPTRYDIRLKIFYTYGQATSLGQHVIRMQPLELPRRQHVSVRHLAISPRPTERREGTDFFGNRVVEVGFGGRVATGIEFRLKAWVERRGQRPGLDISPSIARLPMELAAIRDLDGQAPHHFLPPSPRVGTIPEIAAFAQEVLRPEMTALEAVTALGLAIHAEMEFLPGATDADTLPAEAFRQRKGVCQDYAHIMIAGLRAAGLPAGYVSGFLRTLPPEGQARLEGADAMHAWVRAWCGREIGWVEYDPTNAMMASEDHVVVAYGRDYADVSPVKGVTRMSGVGGTGHSVDVVELPGGADHE
ncbi:transglutaminase family protein [Mangrovicoccus algicola]|uniref:Transglutaminase family protein n=1 Tax=Mangrovicoccus algicola TaxID=2771008 RepID=A0A8J6Z5S6_9RHOB|nr:transglutaminase family protein [Mangrovicoccus algicola]MBE3636956.1 transglutaminase family protein [Mangrovicoccus algicola]